MKRKRAFHKMDILRVRQQTINKYNQQPYAYLIAYSESRQCLCTMLKSSSLGIGSDNFLYLNLKETLTIDLIWIFKV